MAKRFEDREVIRERMYRKADEIFEQYSNRSLSRLGGVDPLVHMLIGACASEFEKVWHSINDSWSRMLSELAKLFSPEVTAGALPAHGVIHATPKEPSYLTSPTRDLIVYNAGDGSKVYFTPTSNFELIGSEVKFIACDNSISGIEFMPIPKAIPLIRSKNRQKLPINVLWIGLDWPKELFGKKSLQLYFDWPDEIIARYSKELLSNSIWKTSDGTVLNSSCGFGDSLQSSSSIIENELSFARKLENQANSFYESRFVRLFSADSFDSKFLNSYPAEFNATFHEDELAKELSQPLLWLKVEFPTPILANERTKSNAPLRGVKCLVNCFPVLNRKLESTIFRLTRTVNLFNLPVGGSFLGIDQVVSSNLKKKYKEKPFAGLSKTKFDSKEEVRPYTIRKLGVNRIDQRDAFEMLGNLMNIIREDIFLFEAVGKEGVSEEIRTIRRVLNDLDRRLEFLKLSDEASVKQRTFIMFPPGKKEDVIVKYWWTDGYKGNKIGPSDILSLGQNTPWDLGSLKFISVTQNGRPPLNDEQKIFELRSNIISRDRIVSRADMKLYCYRVLMNDLKKVEIRKGSTISSDPNEGLIKTLDIHLELKESVDNHDFWTQKLASELNEKSTCLVPIRVFAAK